MPTPQVPASDQDRPAGESTETSQNREVPSAAPKPSTGYEVVDFDALPPTRCPCGWSRRGLMDAADFPGSLHRVEILEDARVHYHKRLTETYYLLECGPDARLQLDGELLPLRPGMCVMIRPGVRHRAIGRMTILNLVFPKFDPADEWFDEPDGAHGEPAEGS